MSPYLGASDSEIFMDEMDRQPELDSLTDLLSTCFVDDYDYTTAQIDIDGDRLYLHGRPELHVGTQAVMTYWRDEVLRPTSVRISTREADALEPLYDMQLVSSSPREIRRTSLLPNSYSLDPDIAQRANVVVSRIRPLLLGDLQLATADPCGDGSHVSWLSRRSELLRMRDRSVPVSRHVANEQSTQSTFEEIKLPDPVLLVRSIATTAALREGAPLEIECSGQLPGGAEWSETQVMENTAPLPEAVHNLSALADHPVALVSIGAVTPNHWKVEGPLRSRRGGWSDLDEPPYQVWLERPSDLMDSMMRVQPQGEVHINSRSVGPFAMLVVENGTEDSDEAVLTRWLQFVETWTLLPRQLEVRLLLTRPGSESAEIS
ncbi:MAG: hypothetical protein AAF368_07315, partial [Planctomycetota bacterium]